MNIKKAEILFIELRDFLRQLNDRDLRIQQKNVEDAVMYLENAESDKEKEEIITTYYKRLYPARGGMNEIVIWDEDFEKRKALNLYLERIEKELFEIVVKMAGSK